MISGKAMGVNMKKRGYEVVPQSPVRKYRGLSLLTSAEKSNTLFGLDD